MRRKDRAITDPARIQEIFDRCDHLVLTMEDGDYPYAVPLSFGYKKTGDQYTLYVHCAQEGKKMDLLKKNPNVGLCLARTEAILTADIACKYSARFESVIGTGKVTFLTGLEEKKEALTHIIQKYNDGAPITFQEAAVEKTAVAAISLLSYEAKANF